MSCPLSSLPSALCQRRSSSLITLEAAKAALPIIFPHPYALMVTEFAFIFLHMLIYAVVLIISVFDQGHLFFIESEFGDRPSDSKS